MTKMLSLILALCLILLAAGAFAEETPFFSAEGGFVFTEPHAHPVMKTMSGSEAPSATGMSGEGSQSAPVIARSLPDAEGNLTYTVSYQSQGNLQLLLQDPDDYSWEDTCYFALEDYRVFDYFTGMNLSPNDVLISDAGELKREEVIQLGDCAIHVFARLDVDVQWGRDTLTQQDGKWLFKQPATIDNVLTIIAPVDYDGLVLGLKSGGVSPMGYYDDWAYWDEFDRVQEWEFIRLSDYAEYETLKKGSRGEAAKVLQQRLSDLGYLTGVVDGDFGPGTEKAVSVFQEAAGLETTGVADNDTLEALFAEDAPRAGD